jgi:hypothetical protein
LEPLQDRRRATDPVGRPSKKPVASGPLVTMVLGTAGFLAGLVFAFAASEPDFRGGMTGKVWVVLVGINGAAWILLLIPAVLRTRAVEGIVQGRRGLLIVTVLYFAMLFAAPLWPDVVTAITDDVVPTMADYAFVLGGGVVAGSVMVGIWRIHTATQDLRRSHAGRADTTANRIVLYLALQDHLQAFLWTLGTMITLGTLTLAFAMKALGAADEVVWAYGLYYTALLALSYAPTYVGLLTTGRSVRDELTGDPPEAGLDLEKWLRRRTELDGLLGLQQGPLGNLKAGIFILSPLLTSIIGTVFERGA